MSSSRSNMQLVVYQGEEEEDPNVVALNERSLPAWKDRIEFATTDVELSYRISTSTWLNGRPFAMPAWLRTVPEKVGYPSQISEGRLRDLRDGAIPCNNNELRYSRNKAVIKQIAADLQQTTEGEDINGQRSIESDTQTRPSDSPEAARAGGIAARNPNDRLMIENGSSDQALATVKSASGSQNGSNTRGHPSSADMQQANLLQRTVLAPFYHRIQQDSDEIARLKQKEDDLKADLAAALEKHQRELAAIHHDQGQEAGERAASPARVAPGSTALVKRAASLISPIELDRETDPPTCPAIVDDLLDLADEICIALEETVPNETIHLCGLAPLKLMDKKPDQVLELASQKIHSWPYRKVPKCWLRLYEDATLSKAVDILHSQAEVEARVESTAHPAKKRKLSDWLSDIVHCLDKGFSISAGLGRSSTFHAVFQKLETYVEADDGDYVPHRFTTKHPQPLQTQNPIARSPKPLNFEAFQIHLDTHSTPLIIPGTLTHWPATTKWHIPRYWLKQTLCGRRIVPVETGERYTDEDWGQALMPFGKFLKEGLLSEHADEMMYLAQHDLFSQLPTLREDIAIPDYCFTSPPDPEPAAARTVGLESVAPLSEPLLNAWIGPKGTQSPLHTDPYHNILCQVFGYKYIRLYSPEQTPNLYPRGLDENGVSMHNTSYADVSLVRNRSLGTSTDLNAMREMKKKYPKFENATYLEAILAPGECLYIPLGWWHYVESLTVSGSVSFWWN